MSRRNLLPDDAHHVVIEEDGQEPERYEVVGVLEDHHRGREYQLSQDGGEHVARVCHAPWVNLSRPRSAFGSGVRITYEWPAKGFRYADQ